MAGISRGLGLSLGTFVVLGVLGYILSLFLDVPVIGEYLGEIKNTSMQIANRWVIYRPSITSPSYPA